MRFVMMVAQKCVQQNGMNKCPLCINSDMDTIIVINSPEQLTDSFIMDIPDELYSKTKACYNYPDKNVFCEKIKDFCVRYIMLKSVLRLETNNLYYNLFLEK